jgi:histidinol-phosphate aminotransferase
MTSPSGARRSRRLNLRGHDSTQQWLAEQRPRLFDWKRALVQLLHAFGAEVLPSVTPFLCARLPAGVSPQTLRTCGIAVRDTGSFGLPGWVRLSAQPPASLDALRQALHELPHDQTLLTTGS